MRFLRFAFAAGVLSGVVVLSAAPHALARGSHSTRALRSKLYRTERQKSRVRKKLRVVKQKQRKTKNELVQAQQKLEEARARLQAARARLRATRAKLARVEAELAGTEARLRMHKKAMAQRVLSLYHSPPPSVLAVVVGAADYSDLVDRIRFVNLITQQDRDLLARLIQFERKRSQQQAELAKLRAEQEHYHAQVQAETAAVAAQERKTRRLLEEILADRKRLEAQLAALEAESKRIQAMLAALQRGRGGLRYRGKWSGRFVRPVPGRITSGFGMRMHPILHYRRMHTGVDMAAAYGTPVKAAAKGLVVYAGWRGGYGKCVIIDHGSGIATLYAHMSRISVRRGQVVKAGQIVGRVGSTGLSTGPHLHFEVRKYGRPVNPLSF